MRLGLVVNPIAGMGGRLAFKGSDDVALVAAARERGASSGRPGAGDRGAARRSPRSATASSCWPTPARWANGRPSTPALRRPLSGAPSRRHRRGTRAAAQLTMADQEVDLLLFAGGDGTAVDVLQAIGERVPVLGIPAGVKMHSAVFAVNPRSAGELVGQPRAGRRPEPASGRGDGRRRGAAAGRLDLGPSARLSSTCPTRAVISRAPRRARSAASRCRRRRSPIT